jgi:CPA2 family monovalent cation:H+ antiporter-2
MTTDPTILLLYEVGLLIVVSALAIALFKRLRLPGLIGAILVGLFIGGPGGLGLVTDSAVVNVLAVLGSVLILFMTGLEFEASAFWRAGRKAFLLTTVGVALSVLVGFGVGLALGWSSMAAFLLGAVIAPSGTSVLAAFLSTEGKTSTEHGSTLLTAAVVDDVEGVVILSIAYGVIASGVLLPLDWVRAGLVSALFILGAIFLGSKLVPRFIRGVEKSLPEEVLLTVLFGLGLMLAFAATLVGLAAITGAFIMGVVIPYKPVGEKLSRRLVMMKDVFAAIFFTSIGLSINPFAIPALLPLALLILAVALLARLGGGLLGGRFGGLHGKVLLALATGLAIRAEMSLIIAREGVALGIVGNDFLALAAVVVIGSILLALPLFVKLSKVIPSTPGQPATVPKHA